MITVAPDPILKKAADLVRSCPVGRLAAARAVRGADEGPHARLRANRGTSASQVPSGNALPHPDCLDSVKSLDVPEREVESAPRSTTTVNTAHIACYRYRDALAEPSTDVRDSPCKLRLRP